MDDVPGESGGSPEDPAAVAELRMRRWRKVRLRSILIVLGVLVVGGFLWKFPRWALRRAHDNAIDCTNQIYRTARGTPSDCEQGGLLAVARLVPWTRKDALQEEADIASQVIEDALKLAARSDLDRVARDRHAVAVFALLAGDRPDPDLFYKTAWLMRSAGGDRVLIEHAGELDDGSSQRMALVAAIEAGDRDAVKRIAALPARGEKPYDFERARGAALCVVGDRAEGIAALERAETLFGDSGYGYLEAKLAIAACDPAHLVSIDTTWRGQLRVAQMAAGGPVGSLGDDARYSSGGALASVVALHRLGSADLDDYLELVAGSMGKVAPTTINGLSPWSILADPDDYPDTPGWADDTAARLISMADSYEPPPRRRRPDDAYEPTNSEILDAANTDPVPFLRWGALVVSLDAAVGWVRRGDLARAQASAGVAMACADHEDMARLEPFAGILVTAVLHLVGREPDAMAAIDVLSARLPAEKHDARALLVVQRVLLLLHAGKPADAWAALDPMMAVAMDNRTRIIVWWLRAATASMLGRELDVPLAPVADKIPYDKPELGLAYWWTAATRPELQVMRRWRFAGVDPGYFDNVGILPAQLYLIGKAAGTGDVELWLDVVASEETMDAQAMASARAEAARWRGDAAAAATWDQRLAAMRALATDDRSAYLLSKALEN